MKEGEENGGQERGAMGEEEKRMRFCRREEEEREGGRSARIQRERKTRG